MCFLEMHTWTGAEELPKALWTVCRSAASLIGLLQMPCRRGTKTFFEADVKRSQCLASSSGPRAAKRKD